MSTPTAEAQSAPHGHRDCSGRERIWLARERESPASATRHPYCLNCGTVRDLTWPRARPLGYYLEGVATLKEYLGHAHLRPKLVEVQSHLITARLKSRLEFEDPYGTPGEAQLEAYADVVRSVRPDLEEELILRLLPGPRARRKSEAAEAHGAVNVS